MCLQVFGLFDPDFSPTPLLINWISGGSLVQQFNLLDIEWRAPSADESCVVREHEDIKSSWIMQGAAIVTGFISGFIVIVHVMWMWLGLLGLNVLGE